jgi:hypothetical protein
MGVQCNITIYIHYNGSVFRFAAGRGGDDVLRDNRELGLALLTSKEEGRTTIRLVLPDKKCRWHWCCCALDCLVHNLTPLNKLAEAAPLA